MTNCGTNSESCCISLEVAGGTYYRTYTNSAGVITGTADPATVSGFRLDKYLVTVGRFRQFVAAWAGGSGYQPPPASGKHSYLNGGQGLQDGPTAGTYETGWLTSDFSNIAPTTTNLYATYTNSAYATWTSVAGSNERLPINTVNWYEAYAFCIWDGGFLPSEAEWEYAAAGGSEQREYPWGSTDPGTSNQYAIYGCDYPSGSGACSAGYIAPVGSAPMGAGLWGQFDLGGDMWEWTLDWYGGTYLDPCTNCASLSGGSLRVYRGGDFHLAEAYLKPTERAGNPSGFRDTFGFRCARTP